MALQNLVGDKPNILDVYPIGSIYISVTNTNPAILFGGIWISWGSGRVLVGVDTIQTEFDTVEETGGNREMQEHDHTGNTNTDGQHYHYSFTSHTTINTIKKNVIDSAPYTLNYRTLSRIVDTGLSNHSHVFTTNTSGVGDSGNLQPYITTYMWKRTE